MQITTFRMIYLTFVNEYDPWPGAPTFRTFQLPELIADTLTAGERRVDGRGRLADVDKPVRRAVQRRRHAPRDAVARGHHPHRDLVHRLRQRQPCGDLRGRNARAFDHLDQPRDLVKAEALTGILG